MAVVNQPSSNPTNKLTAAIVASAIVAFARPPILAVMDIISEIELTIAGQVIPIFAGLASEEVRSSVFVGISTLVIYGAGYLVRDKPNIVAVVPPDDPNTIKTTPAK